jgi:hypothetical protein
MHDIWLEQHELFMLLFHGKDMLGSMELTDVLQQE